jgi:hypothetical protein
LLAEKAKDRMLKGKTNPDQKSDQGKTLKEIGKIAGVSHDTVSKAETILKSATPETLPHSIMQALKR